MLRFKMTRKVAEIQTCLGLIILTIKVRSDNAAHGAQGNGIDWESNEANSNLFQTARTLDSGVRVPARFNENHR